MARKRKPASEPILTCPYTGGQVEIEYCEHNDAYYARGVFDMCKGFRSKQELLYALSTRDGVEPSFPRKHPRIIVGEIKLKQSNPAQGLGRSNELAEHIVAEAFGE